MDMVETAQALKKIRAKIAAQQRATARTVDLSLLAEERRLTEQLLLLARSDRPIQFEWVDQNFGYAGWLGFEGREFATTATSPNPTDTDAARVKVVMQQLRDMQYETLPLNLVRTADECRSQAILRTLLIDLDPCRDPQAWLSLYGRLRTHMPAGGAVDGSEAWLRRLRRDCYAIPLTRAFLESIPDRVANSDAVDVPPESIRLFEEFYPSLLERDDYHLEPNIDVMGGLACGLWTEPRNKYGRMTLWFDADDGVSLTYVNPDTSQADHHFVRNIAHLNSLLDGLIG